MFFYVFACVCVCVCVSLSLCVCVRVRVCVLRHGTYYLITWPDVVFAIVVVVVGLVVNIIAVSILFC